MIDKLQLGNGRWETAKFNERQQIRELALGTSPTDTSLWKLNYEYGELNADGTIDQAKNTGNIAKQTISFAGQASPFVQTYKYDSLYRITEAKEQNGTSGTTNWQQSFGYDRYGNRTGFAQNLGNQATPINSQTLPQVDPTTNRFTDTATYHYDKNGNITNDATSTAGARNFIFNGDNKQTEVKDGNGQTIGKYFYDGEGKRVKKLTVLDSTIFVYSAGKLVAEYTTNAPPQNPTTNYVATDTLQSVRAISDKNGNIISRRDFMPFGEEIYVNTANRTANDKYTNGQDAVRQRFTGYEKDKETDLDFAEARYYNNRHGRFTAVDPLIASGKSANPQTFNRYVYCLNNPLALADHSGMQAGSSTGYWTFRDSLSTDGQTQSRQFVYFHNAVEQQAKEAVWGGNSFQTWNGGQFYIYGENRAIHLPENGNGQLFSTRAISSEDLSNLTSTQESGQSFSSDQTQNLERTYANYLNGTDFHILLAKVEASVVGGALAGAAERGIAAGGTRLTTSAIEPIQGGNTAYSGVKEASKFLQSEGVPRAFRKEILQSFEVETISLKTADNATFGLRFYGGPARETGRYLFPTFTNYANRTGLALPESWNSMSGIRQFQVVSRTNYIFGRAASQGGRYVGGSYQMYINNLSNIR